MVSLARFKEAKSSYHNDLKNEDMKREATVNNSFLGRRAVVIGAGLGGLSAARVLADYLDEVIILDRDELPDERRPTPRRSSR